VQRRAAGRRPAFLNRREKAAMNGKFAKLLVLALLMFSIPLTINAQNTAGGTATVQPASQDTSQYTCPMHPEVSSAAAGTCPKCGMTLKLRSDLAPSPAPAGNRWGANYFPNVTLTTQDGKTVRFYDDLLKDKIVAVELMYTTCKYICPLESARLAQLQKLMGDQMGKSVFFYSITIDPKHDTPEVLKAYAEKFHAGPGWLFLTGKEKDIELISKKLGLYSDPDPKNNPDGHTAVLMIGNVAGGNWMRNSALGDPRFVARRLDELVDDKSRRAEPAKSYAQAPATLNLDKGKYLFAARCAACHTIGHGDKPTGPDLLGVTSTRERAWLHRFIAMPDKVLAEKDPLATALFKKYNELPMPNLGLGEGDVSFLIDYVTAQSAARAPGTTDR
jgi:protein SCO1/2